MISYKDKVNIKSDVYVNNQNKIIQKENPNQVNKKPFHKDDKKHQNRDNKKPFYKEDKKQHRDNNKRPFNKEDKQHQDVNKKTFQDKHELEDQLTQNIYENIITENCSICSASMIINGILNGYPLNCSHIYCEKCVKDSLNINKLKCVICLF